MSEAIAAYIQAEVAAGRIELHDPGGEVELDARTGRLVLVGPAAELRIGDGLRLIGDGIVVWVVLADPDAAPQEDDASEGSGAPAEGLPARPPPPPAMGLRGQLMGLRARAADPEAGGALRGWLGDVVSPGGLDASVPLGPSALPVQRGVSWQLLGPDLETSRDARRQAQILRMATLQLRAERARLGDDGSLVAEDVVVSTCTYEEPHAAIVASKLVLEPTLTADGRVGNALATLDRPRVEALGVPVLGWPGPVTWDTAWSPYVPRVDVGRNKRFGTFVRTSWPVLPGLVIGGDDPVPAASAGSATGSRGDGRADRLTPEPAGAAAPDASATPERSRRAASGLGGLFAAPQIERIEGIYAEGSVHLSFFGDSLEADALVVEIVERAPSTAASSRKGTRVNARLLADYLGDRGVGLGGLVRWRGEHGERGLLRHEGSVFGYAIRDGGRDRDGEPPPTRDRYRIEAFERLEVTRALGLGPTARGPAEGRASDAGALPGAGTLTPDDDSGRRAGLGEVAPIRIEGEVGKLSDRGFLFDFFEGDAKATREQETAAYLRLAHANLAITALARWRLNDFQEQVEHHPRARFAWTAEPFLAEILPWRRGVYVSLDYTVASSRRRFDGAPALDRLDDRVLRADLDHRLDHPLPLGPIVLVPFFSARFTAFSETLDATEGSALRTTLAAGGSATTDIWREVDLPSETLGIDGFRHVFTPGISYRHAFLNTLEPDELIPIDRIEAERRRETLTLSLRNRLVARRGEQRAEFLDLDVRATFFPRPRFEGGRRWGQLEVDARVRPTERWSLRARADWDLETGERVRMDVTASLLAHERLLLFAGYRFLDDPLASFDAVEVGADFRPVHNWGFRGSVQYDFVREDFISTRLSVRRYLHRFVLEATIEGDFGEDDVRFSFAFLPLELFGLQDSSGDRLGEAGADIRY